MAPAGRERTRKRQRAGMSIQLEDFEQRTRAAVTHFWTARDAARAAQQARQTQDQGTRGAVTAGKHMDGFIQLIRGVVTENGLTPDDVYLTGSLTILPGYFRATKSWDLLVVHQHVLVAALELKSQVGPSFGNNFNNRCEEALGSAADLLTTYREGALGLSAPFLGYLMVLEDTPAVHTPVKVEEPHFEVFPEFKGASYAQRYALLCERLVKERLYNAAALLLTPQAAGLRDGEYREPDAAIGWHRMMAALAGHVAAAAAAEQR